MGGKTAGCALPQALLLADCIQVGVHTCTQSEVVAHMCVVLVCLTGDWVRMMPTRDARVTREAPFKDVSPQHTIKQVHHAHKAVLHAECT